MIKDCPKRTASFIQQKNRENLITEKAGLKEGPMKTEKETDPMEIMTAGEDTIASPTDKEEIEEDSEREEIEEATEAETEEEIEEEATAGTIERVVLAGAAAMVKEDTAHKEVLAQEADDHDFVTIDN